MTQGIEHRGFHALTATGLILGLAVTVLGVAFMAEGMMGYFYNTSMFLEGTDHIWEMYGGLAAAVAGIALAVYAIVRR